MRVAAWSFGPCSQPLANFTRGARCMFISASVANYKAAIPHINGSNAFAQNERKFFASLQWIDVSSIKKSCLSAPEPSLRSLTLDWEGQGEDSSTSSPPVSTGRALLSKKRHEWEQGKAVGSPRAGDFAVF
jgi:hypothetical protein